MFLTILFIFLCLAGIIFVLMKWKGSISLIPLGFCLAGIILILYLNTGEKKKEQAQKKIRDLNLIEYVDYIKKSNDRFELTDAATTANVNMRNKAGRDGERILSIPKGTHITVNSTDHDHGWFNVSYDGKRGWVYGKYLQGKYYSIQQAIPTKRDRNNVFVYMFPERTWWGALLGIFIGLSISMYLALIGYYDMLSAKRFGITWAYFMIKNIYLYIGNYPDLLNLGTFLVMLVAGAVLAFVLNALVNLSLNLIDQFRIKAVSH